MLLHDRTAIVTGAASGIGEQTAIEFAANGASVVVADVDVAGGEQTASDIEADGGSARFVRTDVSNPSAVRSTIETTVETYGGLDILCNNAGIEGPLTELAAYDPNEYQRVMDVNLKGVFLGTRYGIEAMRATGGGSVINISSIVSAVGTPGRGVYAASKAGINGMTRVAAIEYASEGIRVNAILPGAVQTPMLERASAAREQSQDVEDPSGSLGRPCRPEDVAHAALFLGSDLSRRITGVCLPVDGGHLAKL